MEGVYFPDDVWYSVYDFDYGQVQAPGLAMLQAPTTSLPPLHVRGGSIMAAQESALTTVEARRHPFELLIASGEYPM